MLYELLARLVAFLTQTYLVKTSKQYCTNKLCKHVNELQKQYVFQYRDLLMGRLKR